MIKANSISSGKKLFEAKMKIGTDEFGKEIRRSFYSTKSKKAAKEKGMKYIEEMAIRNVTGQPAPDCKIKFKSLAKEYLEIYKKVQVKGNTYVGTYRIPVTKYLIPEFGQRDIDNIRSTKIQKYINELARHLSKETIRKILNCLRAIFLIAYNDRWITRDPRDWKFQIPKTKPPRKKRVYSQEQYDRVLDFARTHPKGLSVMTLLKTGISRSELLGLKPENLLDTKELVIVQGTTEIWDPENKHMNLSNEGLKTKYRPRTIPIDTELYEALKHKPRKIIVHQKNGERKEVTPEFLFHSPEGRAYRPSNWYHREYLAFMRDMHKANPDIPILNPHELRHTRATLLNNRNINAVTLNHIFGWRGEGMLETTYAHYDPEKARKDLGLK